MPILVLIGSFRESPECEARADTLRAIDNVNEDIKGNLFDLVKVCFDREDAFYMQLLGGNPNAGRELTLSDEWIADRIVDSLDYHSSRIESI